MVYNYKLQDTNEPGLRGILVDLYTCHSNDDSNNYIFNEHENEQYYIVVTTTRSDYRCTINDASTAAAATGLDGNDNVKLKQGSHVGPSSGHGDYAKLSLGAAASSVNEGTVKMLSPHSTQHNISSPKTVGVSTTKPDNSHVDASQSEDESSSNGHSSSN